LHLVIKELGEILSFFLTPGNVDDRQPVAELVQKLWGKRFGDRGYIDQKLFDELWAPGLQLITKLKKNIKNKLMPVLDKLLRKRVLLECVNGQLRSISRIEHTRHRRVGQHHRSRGGLHVPAEQALTGAVHGGVRQDEQQLLAATPCLTAYAELT
jgi:hypothetical protein